MLRDLALAARRLAATPLFLIFAVGSISIGVATTTAAYSILYTLLWKPIQIGDPDDVVVVMTRPTGSGYWRYALSDADFEALDARQRSFDGLGAVFFTMHTMTTPTSSEVTAFEAVSGDLFRTLRVQAARGRMIQRADVEQQAQVVVLRHSIWRNRFASDPDVVGKTVRIGGQPFEVIGVAADGFDGITMRTGPVAGWIPTTAIQALSPPSGFGALKYDHDRLRLSVIARIAAGKTMGAASAELQAIAAALDAESPRRTAPAADGSRFALPRQWFARSIVTADESATQSDMALLLLLLVGLVLVVACTNLGNLTLSRGAYRQHELAVRRALGASRLRLVRELFAETVLIAGMAAIVTTLLTRALLAFATREISTPSGTFVIEPRLSVAALMFAGGALLISMVVFGLEPALALTRRRAALSLGDGTSTFGAGRSSRQRAFIRWQVAISACFFLIAAILVRAIANHATHDSGIAVSELAIATVHTSLKTSDSRIHQALQRAAEVARQRPDIASVAVSTGMPFGFSWTPRATMTLPDRPATTGQPLMAWMIAASPEIFRTLGVPIVRGRQFDDRDLTAASHVVVLSERTANVMFGTLDAIGRSLTLKESARGPSVAFSVIGIARDTDAGSRLDRRDNVVYVPLPETRVPNFALIARTTGSTDGAARALRDAIRVTDPDLGAGVSGPAVWLVAPAYVAGRLAAMIAGSLGLLTLILAMIGLYGVQVQAVVFRTREIGVRMALGAAGSQIKAMVLREGIRPVVEGIVLGLLLGALARGTLKALVVLPIQTIDVTAFSVVPIPLAIAAVLACYLPARRAARVDPNVALRHL